MWTSGIGLDSVWILSGLGGNCCLSIMCTVHSTGHASASDQAAVTSRGSDGTDTIRVVCEEMGADMIRVVCA